MVCAAQIHRHSLSDCEETANSRASAPPALAQCSTKGEDEKGDIVAAFDDDFVPPSFTPHNSRRRPSSAAQRADGSYAHNSGQQGSNVQNFHHIQNSQRAGNPQAQRTSQAGRNPQASRYSQPQRNPQAPRQVNSAQPQPRQYQQPQARNSQARFSSDPYSRAPQARGGNYPSFAPSSRRDYQPAPSFAPRNSRAAQGSHAAQGSRFSENSRIPQGSRCADSQHPSFEPRSPRGPHAPLDPHSGNPAGEALTKARPKRHIFLRVLAVLLVLILIFCTGVYFWANSKPKRFDALSSRADDSAHTWLILGSDVRDGARGTGAEDSVPGERTDTIMLLIKPASGRAALISIPRDTLVTQDDVAMKINAVAEKYGWPALSAQVESISNIKVDHVVKIGFSGVQNVVDALGGVNLCYDQNVDDANSGMKWAAGCHTVNGEQALSFSRMRYSDPMGDFGRTKRQRQVVAAIAKQTMSPSTIFNPHKLFSVAGAGLDSLTVDNSMNPFNLAQMALAFREATGPNGITGLPVVKSMGYYVDGIGSTVLLNSEASLTLFAKIINGEEEPGVVGGII